MPWTPDKNIQGQAKSGLKIAGVTALSFVIPEIFNRESTLSVIPEILNRESRSFCP